jgi:hypothetical protein
MRDSEDEHFVLYLEFPVLLYFDSIYLKWLLDECIPSRYCNVVNCWIACLSVVRALFGLVWYIRQEV